MGTSNKLHAKLSKGGLSDLPTGKMTGRADMPSVEKFIKDGLDPIHAAYAFVQHITSFFAEGVSQLPEMKKYAKLVMKAEDEYITTGTNSSSRATTTIRAMQSSWPGYQT